MKNPLIIKVKLLKSYPELPIKEYDAIKCKHGYKLFANTGWWLVDKSNIKEII
jgi:hypothetical protein